MKGDNVEISIQIDGEWKQLKHVDMGRDDDQSVVRILTVNGETVTLDIERAKAFLKEQQQFHIDEASHFLSREAVRNLSRTIDIITATTKETNHQLEFYKKLAEHCHVGSSVDIFGGRRSGRRFMFQEMARIREEIQTSLCKQPEPACYCLKCRMGQSHQCMTFSPKKRRGK